MEAGCDAIELDVRPARDGTPVVIHDPTLERTTTGEGRVDDRSVGELDALGVPTLEEVLAGHPRLSFTVDVKAPRVTGRVVALIETLGRADRTVLYVEDGTRLPSFRGYPGPRATSTGQALRMATLYSRVPGLPPRGFPEVVHTPLRKGRFRLVSPRVVRAVHASGRTVQAWTIDDPATLRRLSEWGVDAVVTDDPRAAARLLR